MFSVCGLLGQLTPVLPVVQKRTKSVLIGYPANLDVAGPIDEVIWSDDPKFSLYRYSFGLHLNVGCKWNPRLAKIAKKHPVASVSVNTRQTPDLSFLRTIQKLRRLILQTEGEHDLAVVEELVQLQVLRLYSDTKPTRSLDVSKLTKLTAVGLDSWLEWKGLLSSQKIRYLDLIGRNSTPVLDLRHLQQLEELRLVRCNGTRKVRLAASAKLASLSVARCKSFEAVEPVRNILDVRSFRLEGANRFDMELLRRMKRVRRLGLNALGRLPSLSFLEAWGELEQLSFTHSTVVQDGALGLLLTLPKLKHVSYKSRAHYRPPQKLIRLHLDSRIAASKC